MLLSVTHRIAQESFKLVIYLLSATIQLINESVIYRIPEKPDYGTKT
jgi:hypothetical protein